MQTAIVAGILLNSALYLSACIVLGYLTHNEVATFAALAAIGITYLCYICQLAASYRTAAPIYQLLSGPLVILSMLLGVASGIALLIGV